MGYRSRLLRLALLLIVPGLASADPAPFDLAGPTLEVKVLHAGQTLPISEVPNLSPGDRISILADLPPGQSVHYLLVAAFLRGATNPPPQSWFYGSETWGRKDREGLRITVPKDAQQVLVFLAPETGGAFKTLVGAVRGQPGAFVRASQDLNQATLDRSRLQVYLSAIRAIDQADPSGLAMASPLLARSLDIKFDPSCLQKIPVLQAPCLMQGQDSLILNDGHSISIVEALSSASVVDLAQQVDATRQFGGGYYSPYIASVADIAHILDGFLTAQYQYIPALATEQGDRLSLELNTPPSFHNPKSVLVVALPAVEPPQLPPLHPVDPKQFYCAQKTELVLPAEGAPLAFATGYAHDMVLRLKGKNGKFVNLPVKADAQDGGFVADTAGLSPANFGDILDGSLHGYWGFEPYNGPEFRLENSHPQHWQLADDNRQSLIAEQDDTVHLVTENAACVDSILLQKPTGETVKAVWKPTGPNQVAITVPLKGIPPGDFKLLIHQYGSKQPDTLQLQAYAQAGHLDAFILHAGDLSGVLQGSRLDDVKYLTLNGVRFLPDPPAADGSDLDNDQELPLLAADAKAAAGFKPGESFTASVTLKDGRAIPLDTTVASARPRVALLAISVLSAPSSGPIDIQLANRDEVPRNAQLTFSIQSRVPAAFTGDETVEVSTVNGSNLATLTPAHGLFLEDSHTALATLDTGKAFAFSASGPLRFRIVEQGVAGDWQPLATLVRLPVFRAIQCSDPSGQSCSVTGSDLFLVDSVSDDPQFDHSTPVPEGFTGYSLTVPHPADGLLYVKLHDDPSVVNSVTFPAPPPPPPVPEPLTAATPAAVSDATQTIPAIPSASHVAKPTAGSPSAPAGTQSSLSSATSAVSAREPAAAIRSIVASPSPQRRLSVSGSPQSTSSVNRIPSASTAAATSPAGLSSSSSPPVAASTQTQPGPPTASPSGAAPTTGSTAEPPYTDTN